MKNKTLRSSVTAFGAALLVTLIILLLIGKNPIEFLNIIFTSLFKDTSGNLLKGFLQKSLPILFAGLGVAFAFRVGLFNIGADGQLTMGMLGALAIGIIPNIHPVLHIPMIIIAGAILGALWGFIPGMLKAYMGVHEVVITIMMNYIATYLMKDLFLPYFGDPSKSGTQTYPMQPSARLTNLNTIKILNIPLGIIIFFMIGILAVLLYTFIIEKTKKGFEFRAVGLNRHAADYAGINSTKSIAISMVISGAFAGVGGAFYMIFTSTLATGGFAATSIGFDGLAAALLGGSTGLGTLISSLVLSYLEIVSLEIQYLLRVPKEVTGMITALVLFFIAMNKLFDNTWSKKPSRKKDISKKDGSEDNGLSSKNI